MIPATVLSNGQFLHGRHPIQFSSACIIFCFSILNYLIQILSKNDSKVHPRLRLHSSTFRQNIFRYDIGAADDVSQILCNLVVTDVIDDDGFYVQEYTIHIGEPIYPDKEKNRNENIEYMMQKNSEVWKDIYEKTYNIPLKYADDKIV